MLDAIRKHTQGWLAKVILAAITIPFALFGIDSYLNQAGGNVAVAKIGSDKISIQEYNNTLENVRNRMQSSGEKVDPAMLESPLFKQSVLDGIITKRLVSAEIKQENFKISNKLLSEYILGMPEFQQDGKFSEDLYQKTLEQNKLTATKFENNIRGDLLLQQARDGMAKLAFAPTTTAQKALEIAHQQRIVTTAEFKANEFLADVKVTPEAVKAYYELHKDKLVTPEQVKLQFALLSAAGLVAQMHVTDDEVKAFYDQNKEKFQGDEQRHASHILIGFGVNASDKDKQAAKEKAQGILDQLRKSPKKFEELATKYSQDPGSASKGGDLGSFGRGAMVKPFEDAVFSMKPGQISDLVESEFGYHIIRLDDVSGNANSFDSLKAQIKGDLLFQKAQAKYAELTEDFSNAVYEQSGSLDPVAKKFNLELQSTPWLSREDGAKFFKSPQLMSMVFSDQVLKEKRNTEAVEVSPNNLVSARLQEYKPAAPKTFDEVKGGIEALLKLEQALKLAKDKGEATLAKLNAGQDVPDLDWITDVTVDRKSAQGLSNEVMNQVFKINAAKLPAYAGFTDNNRAYMLVKVTKVLNPLAEDQELKKAAQADYEDALGSEYISDYVQSLKSSQKIQVNGKLLFGEAQQ